jgi:Xaa-Pro aminopeptidase
MKTRIEKLNEYISDFHVDALIVTEPKDLYYLLGLKISKGTLIVFDTGAHLFVDGRYFEACKDIRGVVLHPDTTEEFKKIFLQGQKFGFDEETTTYSAYDKFLCYCQEKALVPIKRPVWRLRTIKDREEIEKISKACRLTKEGFQHILGYVKEGVLEEDLARELEVFWLQHGGDGAAFEPIVAAGVHSSFPHWRAGNARVKKGDVLLVDIGAVYESYCSDMTRVIFFGDVPPAILQAYKAARRAFDEVKMSASPGVSTFELDSLAHAVIEEEGYGANFTHGLGHGVGLDIHEWPILKKHPDVLNIPLEVGMVITIEPGIYLPGIGGIRLEDTCVIEEGGARSLIDLPLDPILIR